MKFLSAFAALLTACSSPKPPLPDKPGTSLPLSYPILMIGTEAPTISVYDREEDLTTTSVSSNPFYTATHIVDSAGRLYKIGKDTAIGDSGSVWRDMGTRRYRLFLEVKFLKKVDVEQTRKMVLNVVRSPRNQLSRPPERLSKAVAPVESYRTLSELIEGCRDTLAWIH